MTKVSCIVESVRFFIQLTSAPVMYLLQKDSIAGPPFKIPLMGPFLQAIDPKFEAYLAQWASGPLSCVSVFHKYVLSLISLSSCANSTSSRRCPYSHFIFQIRCPRLRPRSSPQGFQITLIRRAMHSSDRKRHHRPQSMGLSSR